MWACHIMGVEVWRQLWGVGSYLLLCGSWGWSSGWRQVPSLTEPGFSFCPLFFDFTSTCALISFPCGIFYSSVISSQCTPCSVHPPPFYHPTHMQSKVTTVSQANSKWPRQTPGLWLPWSVAGEQDFHCNAELCSGGELHLWSPLGVTHFHRF